MKSWTSLSEYPITRKLISEAEDCKRRVGVERKDIANYKERDCMSVSMYDPETVVRRGNL